MNEKESTVTEILDDNAKYGTSKQGKPWSMSRVGLENGESAFIFNPIAVGDTVVEVQNGEFKNWNKKKADPKHDEIIKLLKQILKAVGGEKTSTPDEWS